MTPEEEKTFIQLWHEGASYTVIARALGIPGGTVGSRAKRLAAQGKIQPRPRGGAYPKQHALARHGVSTDTPWVSTSSMPAPEAPRAGVSPDTRPVQYVPPSQGEMLPLLGEILQELRQLTSGLAARVSPDTPPPLRDTPRVSARTPLPPERGKSVRWNLHLSEALRDRIKATAKGRGLQDSQMVEELLWLALAVVEEER